jgi:hypothetical protein
MHSSESSTSISDRDAPETITQHRWHEHIEPWRKALLAILPLFIITRLLFLLLTYVGSVLFPGLGGSSFALTPGTMLYSWYHADALRLLTIATAGYPDQSYTGFFPLYPTIVHTVSALLHLDILSTGIVISNLAFLVALSIFYRLVEDEFGTSIARRSALYFAFFPTAFFTFNAYTISLLLMFAVSCCYLLRRQSWIAAACVGGLATLTDLAGVLLFLVFLYEFAWRHKNLYQSALREKKINNVLLPSSTLLASLIILLGYGIYCYALAKQLHDPFAFLHPQGSGSLAAPWTTLWGIFQTFFTGFSAPFAWVNAALELVLLLGSIVLLALYWLRPQQIDQPQRAFTSFSILLLLYLLLFPTLPSGVETVHDPLPALQSLIFLSFSSFIMLAHLGKNRWLHYAYLTFSTICLILLVFSFFHTAV